MSFRNINNFFKVNLDRLLFFLFSPDKSETGKIMTLAMKGFIPLSLLAVSKGYSVEILADRMGFRYFDIGNVFFQF